MATSFTFVLQGGNADQRCTHTVTPDEPATFDAAAYAVTLGTLSNCGIISVTKSEDVSLSATAADPTANTDRKGLIIGKSPVDGEIIKFSIPGCTIASHLEKRGEVLDSADAAAALSALKTHTKGTKAFVLTSGRIKQQL